MVEQIERDFDRDRYMSAEEARAYGIVDNVISTPAVALAGTNGANGANGHGGLVG